MLQENSTVSSKPTPRERLAAQPLIVGLFLPTQSGGWTPSTAPRGTSWDIAYNTRLAIQADELGFDLAFSLAQWLGAGGYGGRMRYREMALDPLVVTAALSSVTRNIVLISTVHVLYRWHPLHFAKLGATIDHMSGGRWGANIVTGHRREEALMFGLPQVEHDRRYEMAAEFLDAARRLWEEESDLTLSGDHFSMAGAFVTPKPKFGRPIIVSASSSDAGFEFAAKHSDLLFITSPAGSNIDAALEVLPAYNRHIKSIGLHHGRSLRTIINPHIICRDTEREAQGRLRQILAGEDSTALDNFVLSMHGGDTRGWSQHRREGWAVGGNIQIIGSPEMVADALIALRRAGCDGVQLCFFDFEPDLAYFGRRVLPLLAEAGLRVAS